MTEPRIIDYSRYRVAEVIVERWRGGESAAAIGADYFGPSYADADFTAMSAWLVELIVAASDPKDEFAGVATPNPPREEAPE